MRSSFFILITILIYLSTAYATYMRVNLKLDMPQPSDITEYRHPFRDVNVDRPQSFWNIDQFEIQTNSMQDYELENKLGNGAYGVVYKAKHTPSGDICAFKHLVNSAGLKAQERSPSHATPLRHPQHTTYP